MKGLRLFFRSSSEPFQPYQRDGTKPIQKGISATAACGRTGRKRKGGMLPARRPFFVKFSDFAQRPANPRRESMSRRMSNSSSNWMTPAEMLRQRWSSVVGLFSMRSVGMLITAPTESTLRL